MFHVREVPQLAGHAKHIPRRRFPPALGPLLEQQSLYRFNLSSGTEILMVWELIVKPSASIVMSVFFLGARMGVTPTSPDPNKRT